MGLRPIATRWVEVLCAADDVARAAEALARTGHVQLESRREVPEQTSELRARLPALGELARVYGRYWPRSTDAPPGPSGSPVQVLERGLAALRAWARQADPIIERLQALELELERLELLRELLESGGDDLPDLALLTQEHTIVEARLLVLPSGSDPPRLSERTLARRVDGPRHTLILALAPATDGTQLDQAAEAARARHYELPSWLPARPDRALEAVERRCSEVEREQRAAWDALDRLHDEHGVRTALQELRRLEWYVSSVPPPAHTRHFALVEGWTDAPELAVLEQALEGAGVRALVRLAEPPEGASAPMVLRNPRWARPFEVFASLVGVPARGEVDPSSLLGVIVPLLFGYMFGDVGHGVVLVIAGWLLRGRVPALRLLVPGGVAAIAFGFLFGSVFAVEGVIPALWIHPMEHPLTLLATSVVGGAAILTIGLLLGGLGAAFQGRLGHWLLTDAAVLVIYVGVLSMFLHGAGALVALGGVAWLLIGSALSARARPVRAALTALGHLVERLVQIGVNTVSFARVGAFALAHAGLSAAVTGVTHGAGPVTTAVVLVLGNVLIVVLEGLVVSIQTTRLVLFEFFVRFFKAEGRAFTPQTPPPADTLGFGGEHTSASRSTP